MKTLGMALVGAAVLLGSADAQAETAAAPFNPDKEFRPVEFPWESGFIPNSGPLQINLTATPYQEVYVGMFGDGEYDFDETSILFVGDPDSGTFRNTLGADVTVIIAIDALGINTEFEVGVYSIEEDASAEFTPYVLPGADPRPIFVAEQIGPNNLVNEDFVIPGFDIPGTINIDYVIDIPGISYESHRIDLTDGDDSAVAQQLGSYDIEGQNLELVLPDAAPGQTSSVWGTLNGELDSEIAITFTTTVSVTVFEQNFDIGPIDIQLDYPVTEDYAVVFDPIEMQYTTPDLPAGTTGGEDPTTGGDGSTSDGDSDSDSDSAGDTTTGAPPTDPTTGGDTDTDGGFLPAGEAAGDGCGCRSSGGTGWAGALALLGLVAVRRRRD